MACRPNYFLRKLQQNTTNIIPLHIISSGAQFTINPFPKCCPEINVNLSSLNVNTSSIDNYLSSILYYTENPPSTIVNINMSTTNSYLSSILYYTEHPPSTIINIDTSTTNSYLSSILYYTENPPSTSSIENYLSSIANSLEHLSTSSSAGNQNVNQNVEVNIDMEEQVCLLKEILGAINNQTSTLSTFLTTSGKQDVTQNVEVNVDFDDIKQYISSLISE